MIDFSIPVFRDLRFVIVTALSSKDRHARPEIHENDGDG